MDGKHKVLFNLNSEKGTDEYFALLNQSHTGNVS